MFADCMIDTELMEDLHMSKKTKLFIFLGLIAVSITFFGYGVFASSDDVQSVDLMTLTTDEYGNYSLEDMLTYALIDEYTAKATYEAMIETYGNIKPFKNIVLAEQTHIDLLLPLFETYGIDIPVNDIVITSVPDSISSALATGVTAEEANIALYEAFLSQDLPDDVRTVFEYLQQASEHHLAAFSKDRLFGAGYDLANGIKNQWKKMFKGNSSQNGQRNQSNVGNGYCINE